MPICNGAGDRGGDHCCYIDGKVCEVLVMVDGLPRCPFMLKGEAMKGNPVWERLPAGKFYARLYPGFDCADWPQAIPEVMAGTARICCWSDR